MHVVTNTSTRFDKRSDAMRCVPILLRVTFRAIRIAAISCRSLSPASSAPSKLSQALRLFEAQHSTTRTSGARLFRRLVFVKHDLHLLVDTARREHEVPRPIGSIGRKTPAAPTPNKARALQLVVSVIIVAAALPT